jgi:type 1 glutamine amidotransferase
MSTSFALLTALTLIAGADAPQAAPPRIRVLSVTGIDSNAHPWKERSAAVTEALQADPRFALRVVEDPAFVCRPEAREFDVLVLHLRDAKPIARAAEICERLTQLVGDGKGLVLIHGATGAFPTRLDYRDLAGRTWGPKYGHDPRGPFTVKIVAPGHPLVQGLTDFQADDELYFGLAGDRPIEVLATAQSKKTGKAEPVAFVFPYGRGRVFSTVLGHDAKAIRVSGTSELLRRACAWAAPTPAPGWDKVRPVTMQGDLKAYWNVGGGDVEYNNRQALARGFRLVNLLGTYSDYPGGQRENIDKALTHNRTNPWKKPDYFERIIRRNLVQASQAGEIMVHDIEFPFEEDVDKAWADAEARAASGAKTKQEFAKAYFRQWASWFALPCQWNKQDRPYEPVGLYGPQPFRRDYWGVAGKSAQQIDGTHRNDSELWQWIDPHVDFYIASVYVFYDDPGSIYYIAANVEENYQRTRSYGNKPVYAYEWLRYHNSNKRLVDQELAPYLVDAMAVVPYFCGAKGVVVWGWEPRQTGQYYQRLPLFAQSLGRVSDLSAKISRAQLVIDEPACVLWKEKRPLVRKLKVSDHEWLVLAVNPWQTPEARSSVRTACGSQTVELPLVGRGTGIFQVLGARVTAVK